MQLQTDIRAYGCAALRKLDKHGWAALGKLSTEQLREIVLTGPTAVRLMAAAGCSSLDDLLARTIDEQELAGATLDYITSRTGVELPDTSYAPLLMPIAEKWVADGTVSTFQRLLSRLAVVVLAAQGKSASA